MEQHPYPLVPNDLTGSLPFSCKNLSSDEQIRPEIEGCKVVLSQGFPGPFQPSIDDVSQRQDVPNPQVSIGRQALPISDPLISSSKPISNSLGTGLSVETVPFNRNAQSSLQGTFFNSPPRALLISASEAFYDSPTGFSGGSPLRIFGDSPLRTFCNSPSETFSDSPPGIFSNSPPGTFYSISPRAFSDNPLGIFSDNPPGAFYKSPLGIFGNSPPESLYNSPLSSSDSFFPTPPGSINSPQMIGPNTAIFLESPFPYQFRNENSEPLPRHAPQPQVDQAHHQG